MKQLPFNLRGIRLRSKVPILMQTRSLDNSKSYYPAGTIFTYQENLDYAKKFAEEFRGLRRDFAMTINNKKFDWYEAVLVAEDETHIRVAPASMFLLFEPVDENGDVIVL